MTTLEKESMLKLHEFITRKLKFESVQNTQGEINYRRTVLFNDIGMLVVTVFPKEMKCCISNSCWYWKKEPVKITHDIPEIALDNEYTFGNWIDEIIKTIGEASENVSPTN